MVDKFKRIIKKTYQDFLFIGFYLSSFKCNYIFNLIFLAPNLSISTNIVDKTQRHGEDVREKTVNNKNKKNICNICNFVSTYHKDLVRHMRTHTGKVVKL